jgi:hypothetical protein
MPEFRDFVCFLSAKTLHYTHCLWFSRFCQNFLPFFRESQPLYLRVRMRDRPVFRCGNELLRRFYEGDATCYRPMFHTVTDIGHIVHQHNNIGAGRRISG